MGSSIQITQYLHPLGVGGRMEIDAGNVKESKTIRINRIHLEEDAGKLLHPEQGEPYSRVDYNRCGVPLIEIVSDPDIASPAEAYNYLLKLRQVLQYLGICTGDMEKGHLRCDANVSVRRKGVSELGVRTEVKNLNSFKYVEKALAYEIERQAALIKSGQAVEQCTMLWNEKKQTVEPMRTKEACEDYRYFPEPDLPPLVVSDAHIDHLRSGLPELPKARFARFVQQYNLSDYDIGILTESRPLADYFEAVMLGYSDSKTAANWMINELLKVLNERNMEIDSFNITPVMLSDLLNLIQSGEISGKIAKDVFAQMVVTGKSAEEIMKDQQLSQITDYDTIAVVIDEVLGEEKENVERFMSGKEQLFDYFIGQVMKKTKGMANPELVNKILWEKLNGLKG
ncbi:MAG: Asp-tRNA(Asn)/Glu-tRNA(Gln) amidotransferase GatCAB subunit B [candidate division Zixibacteria bacterium HGW-Zixibacteria-1]|nr:MAG: Asp-tRNA(Asn)/Glu-tRNA(Gln) amidotransferase GatCAB subunit B [candidate division Zixibacteria bacterium HGW-Zixibacteria-1]